MILARFLMCLCQFDIAEMGWVDESIMNEKINRKAKPKTNPQNTNNQTDDEDDEYKNNNNNNRI